MAWFVAGMKRSRKIRAFTLVELLVTVAILAILAAVSFPFVGTGLQHANCSACSSNMRSLGIAFLSYSIDNDGTLPGRTQTGGGDKWPTLLLPYVGGNAEVYVDPGDPVAVKIPLASLVSNTSNNSSFFFNGFNDLGAYTNPAVSVCLYNVTSSSNLILLAQQKPGSDQFYMDFVEGNQDDIINKQAYFGGANYAFADSSVRFIKATDYQDSLWLVNQSYIIPPVPPGH